ncbi:MAG: PilZ domain-containing protein [Phycisphaeraceae bacterium]
MSEPVARIAEARQAPRLKLPAMYTLVRVRPKGSDRYKWTGYIYDVSASGMRFELDYALEPGTEVEVRAMLPGAMQMTVHASGKVVRLHDDHDERGPMRMGMSFDQFGEHRDRRQLMDYLEHAGVKMAA